MLVKCQSCNALVEGKELFKFTANEWVEFIDSETIQMSVEYRLLQCPRCNGAILWFMDEHDNTGVLWPREDKVSFGLPRNIKNSLEEAITCFEGKAFTATAIMCRKALEGMCSEYEVEEETLEKSLLRMKELGVIEGKLHEWATALRMVGNEAAHDVKVTVKADDAKDIVDFTKALSEYLFTFKEKFESFMKRRGNKK